MSREDVPESLKPIWHLWTRVGPTRDHIDRQGTNWPTVDVICDHCREFRPDVAVSLFEGTTHYQIPRDYWPGYCNLSEPSLVRMKPPADTSWLTVEVEPEGPGPVGRGVLKTLALAIAFAFGAFCYVGILESGKWSLWLWVPAWGALGLGLGLNAIASQGDKKKRKTKQKG